METHGGKTREEHCFDKHAGLNYLPFRESHPRTIRSVEPYKNSVTVFLFLPAWYVLNPDSRGRQQQIDKAVNHICISCSWFSFSSSKQTFDSSSSILSSIEIFTPMFNVSCVGSRYLFI